MSKRRKLAIPAAAFAVAGLVIVLAFAGVAAAAPATSSPVGATAALGEAAPVYGWVVQLRGAINENLSYKQFAAMAAKAGVGATWTDDGGTPADPSDDRVYAGIPLWRLVALVDDKNPKTFNDALAAKGYSVQVVALDGFAATLPSILDTVSPKPWVRDNTAIVADQVNGAPLPFGSFSVKHPDRWTPSWPLQLVSPTLPGNAKPGGAVTIIVYKPGVTPPTNPVIQPSWDVQVRGASNVDYTAAQFRALAKAHTATWSDDEGTADASDDQVYTGASLWRLVALADGGSSASLNLDRLGLGYKVDVFGMGATAPAEAQFDAPAIAGKSNVVIADRVNGAQLTPTQGNAVQQLDMSYLWQPTWPARIVGSGVTVDQSFGGVLRVVLEKPVVPSYVTPLVLKGRRTARIGYLSFPTPVTWNGNKAGNINPTLRAVYRGQTLYKLVGLVDDKHPKTFNVALAHKGYKVEFIGRDGYTWTISSKTIIGKKRWIVASLKDGAVMSSDEGPYRNVGSFIKPFYGKPSVSELIKIKLIF
jgi:hypothetical protein